METKPEEAKDKGSFGIEPEEIYSMLSPTDPKKYKELGGLEGMAKLLKSDLHKGLNVPFAEDGKPSIVQVGGSSAVSPHSTKAHSRTAGSSHELKSATQQGVERDLEERMAVFGTNRMPEPVTKTIWAFVWDTFQDKMLLLLCFAAAAEIAIGSYKAATKGDNIELIDGFAVLFAGKLIFPRVLPRLRSQARFLTQYISDGLSLTRGHSWR
jgi:Ca2+-transporting ATPase